ncbi:MAG: carbon-nitrogen hydrolase family protein [Clostridia bacterium]|nr:carbon-nitrogen hydrolase family protein [Clostridia bacterium]
MRIRFIGKGTPLSFSATEGEEKNADVTLFGFYDEEVSYERELKGETRFFESVARLSKTQQSVVACGCITDTKGLKRKSVAVAENGRLIGVSDMLNAVDGAYASGAALRVYETGVGRMGVVVSDDLRFPEVIKSLAVCGSDFIVCPFGRMDGIQSVLLRAHAYCYGVPIYFCADGYCMIADVSGEIVFASPQSPVTAEYLPRKEYHLVETRRRGFYKAR